MKPNFSKYSIEELKDVIIHIDSDVYPERKREAEKILQQKLEDGGVESSDDGAIDKRSIIYLCTICIIVSLILLYNPVFENTVLTRSQGVIHYSQSPSSFWFYTILYLANFLGFTYWLVKITREK